MAKKEEAPHPMTDRVFGVFVGGVLSVISVWPVIFNKPHKSGLLTVAVTLVILGLVSPSLLKWPKTIWLFITHKISVVVNFLLLSIMFFAVVTPVALFFRLIGRDPLNRKLDGKALSYWVPRTAEVPRSMQNQF